MANPMKIGLLGPYGYGNLGDAAIQEAMIQNIRQRFPHAQIVGFSLNPQDTEERHKIPAYPITRPPDRDWLRPDQTEPPRNPIQRLAHWLHYHPSPWLRKLERVLFRIPLELVLIYLAFTILKGFDYLAISGGGQLDDYWGGAWSHPYTLLKWSLLAKVRGAQLLFVSVGAGPIQASLSRRFFTWALSLADYRSYRDGESKAYMAKLGFQRPDPVYPDLAHSLPVDPNLERARPTSAAPLVVGVGPMAYFDPRVWPERDSAVYLGYLHKLTDFVRWMFEQGYTVRFFPGDFHYDGLVIEDLMRLIPDAIERQAQDKLIYEPVCTVDGLLAQLAATDLVLTSRFHGVLLAHRMQKPVLALSYHQKIDTLMAAAGQSAYNLQIDNFDLETLIECFHLLKNNLENARAKIVQREDLYRAELDEQYARIFNHA